MSTHHTKVLLVEDDEIVQYVHKQMLSKLGCDVDIAPTGHAALSKVSPSCPYAIIFVDIGLADMSGIQLIKAMRSCFNELGKPTPIIALTGYTGEEEQAACLAAGAERIIHKPVVTATLRAILAHFLD